VSGDAFLDFLGYILIWVAMWILNHRFEQHLKHHGAIVDEELARRHKRAAS
jgi:hypothetical protein